MIATVIGDGGWGTALALTLVRNGHAPRVWGPDAAYSAEVRATRRNPRFMPGVELPEGIVWTADPAEALAGSEAVVFVVPSKFARATLERFKPAWEAAGRPPVVSATKGFDMATRERISELVREVWGAAAAVLLVGGIDLGVGFCCSIGLLGCGQAFLCEVLVKILGHRFEGWMAVSHNR